VDAFDLVADSYAPRAYDAPVSVDNKEIMGWVDFVMAPVALKHDVIYA
jgi:hypothetical protein